MSFTRPHSHLPALVLSLLQASGLAIGAGQPRCLVNGCGPVAVYAAARCAGYGHGMRDVVIACRWREAEPLRIDAVLGALRSLGVPYEVAHLTPQDLRRVLRLRNTAAMLLVRGDQDQPVNHLVVAVGTRTDSVAILDYPRLPRAWDRAMLLRRWSGDCIVVSGDPALLSEIRRLDPHSASNAAYLAAALAAIAGCVALAARRRAIGRRPSL